MATNQVLPISPSAPAIEGTSSKSDRRIVENVLELIGHTPMIRLGKLSSTGKIFCKCEFLNPGGSIKDRIALRMIEAAEKDGRLHPGMTIIEVTSGNTGIGFALTGRQKGYDVMVVMPENMSEERKKIMRAFGAQLILTPAEGSFTGAIQRATEIVAEDPERYYRPDQFTNPINPQTHYEQTAAEIWEAMEGQVDIFISGIGSGGTFQGIGRFLKEKNPDVKLVAVEPQNSAALLSLEPGLHAIQGIGDGFVPAVLDKSLIDIVVMVSDEEAIDMARQITSQEGLLVGTSSGANVAAALQLDTGRANIVTILPDRAERYFSTALI
eukprot:gnl/Trimastix_PCT/1158.p1 GENE.gnl/Trimastix_PCT/1158~~gnl/Trimastix_PCT/1158.p1  ORF type:complete len:325 (-),score=102.43 gnl/Trimastix_PCT/1158:1206-2180(-)